MSVTVPRTCTEIPPSGADSASASDPMPLSAFREIPAYVLLGDPGAGKTTEFRRESAELEDNAMFVTVRDLVADVYLQELEGRTLFIDGLDEMRAGAPDARAPLDEIRKRLARLGRPNFRISCREADWLGPSDRRSLETISPDSTITVLLLDPLNEQNIHELLVAKVGSGHAEAFEEEATRRGLEAMLRNPQTLRLLVGAVGHGDDWPESRLETIEAACKKMASEHNDERRDAVSSHPTEAILDTAGRLCALLLLCGFEGYTLAPRSGTGQNDSAGLMPLDDLGHAAAEVSRQELMTALGTNLFTPDGEREFVPCHRQVAEFLAGRYLAKLIEKGLPARRVVGLMTGASDGRVVTQQRGLSAWLAAHPGEARRQLMDADPVGVGLYGDMGRFTTDDKQHLLRSLAAFATQGPLLGHTWQDGQVDGHGDDTSWAFRSLASTDLVESIGSLLRSPTRESYHDRTMAFILEVLAKAEPSEKQSLTKLEPDLMAILYAHETPSWIRTRALDAFNHIARPDDETVQRLTALLAAIHGGSIPDPEAELREGLLASLYPNAMSPEELWRSAFPQRGHGRIGNFGSFWDWIIREQCSDQDIAELLDALHEHAEWLIPALSSSFFDDLPVRLLARGLSTFGESLKTERLFGWLDVTGRLPHAFHRAEAHFVREWLTGHPHVQRAVFLSWLRQRVESDPGGSNRHWPCDALLRSQPPGDFGQWCLDQATRLQSSEPELAKALLGEAYVALFDPAIREGLTQSVIREQVGTGELARYLHELDGQRSATQVQNDAWLQRMDEERARQDEREKRHQEERSEGLRARLKDLRDNRLSPPDLDTLAQAYIGTFSDVDQEASPWQRVDDFIGGDEVLVDAVVAAIRDAVFRDDLPTVDETVSLHCESKRSWLAYPVLVSLQCMEEEDLDRLYQVNAERKRRVLAIYYSAPSDEWDARWHDRLFQQEPELVLDVLCRCAIPAVRAGAQFVPGLDALFDLDGHEDLVHDARLKVLEAAPIRGSNQQLGLLDDLLARAMRHQDPSRLLQLVRRKLSLSSTTVAQRVRWLAVEALLAAPVELGQLKDYVGKNAARAEHLAGFLWGTSPKRNVRESVFARMRDPAVLRDVIEMLSPTYPPVDWGGWITLGMQMSVLVTVLIDQLGTLTGEDVDRAFTELVADPRMTRWQDRLKLAHERQRVVHRDASYSHPGVEQVQRTLCNDAPANAADLAALLVNRFDDISKHARGDSSNPWQQFWNEDQYGRPTEAKIEDSCRDALLAMLKERLPVEVDATPEGRYAAGNRADIRASCSGFNVPVEIKKNSHPDLWTAIRRQLIAKYTTDQATSGYGIYLVLWFGADETKTPPDGKRPGSPEKLEQRLVQELTGDEARKISVIVMDVTKPGGKPQLSSLQFQTSGPSEPSG